MAAESVDRQPLGNQQVRVAILIVVLVAAIGVVVWLVAFHSSKHKPKGSFKTIGPKAFSAKNLKEESIFINTKFYWAGPQRGYTYEFTRNVKGYLYVRYLPHGVKPGAKGAHYLIVATYPFPGAYAALQKEAKGRGQKGPGGSLVLVRPKDHKSVLMAFPKVNRQIEIYDPDPVVAINTALSGKIKPVR